MDTGQKHLIQLDSSQDGAKVGLLATSEQKKKLSSVGFYELDVLQTPKNNDTTEDTKSVDVDNKDNLSDRKDTDSGYMDKVEEKVTKNDTTPDYLDKAEENSHNHEDQSLNYFDQNLPNSSQHCTIHKGICCPCKECVENFKNKCEEVQNPTNDDDPKNDEFLPCDDRASVNSNRSRSDSEKSRHSKSSEEECMGNRYHDTQVTLPYPDNTRPPECITRLSNAGLYEPNEELAVKGNKEEEDKLSQVVSTAFFVQHPEEIPTQQKKVQLELVEKVDIEKGDAECEPLIRSIRRTAHEEPLDPRICQCNRGCLKIVGSFVTSMIIFPAFLYGAYAWLPFDAPLMPDIPTRLVYTLRCASFASFPIVLGK
uniref:Uncharacterized protein n=2 Tax=Pyxicephalus adspersus TaxID=30357 RepID=A0AAV2ZQ31_PYXAD|nr:TPA: hypothetical protein GDO54_004944 [Pyxicephalus adspersus]